MNDIQNDMIKVTLAGFGIGVIITWQIMTLFL